MKPLSAVKWGGTLFTITGVGLVSFPGFDGMWQVFLLMVVGNLLWIYAGFAMTEAAIMLINVIMGITRIHL